MNARTRCQSVAAERLGAADRPPASARGPARCSRPAPSASGPSSAAGAGRGWPPSRRPRVPSTISFTSLKSGHAASTVAPSERKTRGRASATRATSASTGISPLRSGVHATRQPLTDGALTAREELARVHVVGERRPVVGAGDHREHQRGVGDRARHRAGHADRVPGERPRVIRARGPGVVRKPDDAAEGRRASGASRRVSEPWASGPMPVASATAAPPLEPPQVSAGFHGLRVGAEHRVERVAARAELRRVGLADHDGARRLEPLHDERVLARARGARRSSSPTWCGCPSSASGP